MLSVFSLILPPPPRSSLFPYTTLFRSLVAACTPITTRPDFRPDPGALVVILDARPERITAALDRDRKSTRLNSSHVSISYAVFCLKKKNSGPALIRRPARRDVVAGLRF